MVYGHSIGYFDRDIQHVKQTC